MRYTVQCLVKTDKSSVLAEGCYCADGTAGLLIPATALLDLGKTFLAEGIAVCS